MSLISLTRADFTKLFATIKIIQDSCTDCDISGGFIRQKTNDRSAIVEIDLTNILKDNNLSISLIKQKVLLLKSFELDDNVQIDDDKISIIFSDNDYTFTDFFSNIIFRKPSQKYLDNKFISEDDFKNMIKIKDDDLVLNYDIPSHLAKRIKSICEGFNVDTVLMKMDEYHASIHAITINNENTSRVIKEISLNTKMAKSNFKMIVLPFMLDVSSDIKLLVYNISQTVMLCKFQLTHYDIPISIYCKVKVEVEK
tara:strand:- start:2189 stop:2950 length:762 start_codon:yes stop_codon:yes gene_type:complete